MKKLVLIPLLLLTLIQSFGQVTSIIVRSQIATDIQNNSSRTITPAKVRSSMNRIVDLVDVKANIASPVFTGTVSGITKTMVGLPLVDNTADVNKPISTLQQVAFNQKLHTVATIATLQAFTDADKCEFDGSTWERKSGNVASNGGGYAGTIVQVSASFYWERKFSKLDISFFGANPDGSTSNDTQFNNAVTYANNAGITEVHLPKGTYNLPVFSVGSRSAIRFTGEGKIVTTGSVATDFLQPSKESGIKNKSFSSLNPSHLKQFISALNGASPVNVTFWGTSLSMGNAGSSVVLTPNDTYTRLLEKSLKKAYGEDKMSFFYRGIGSTNAGNAKGDTIKVNSPGSFDITSAEYSWGIVGQRWINLVKATSPDLLVIGWSMNDMGDLSTHAAYKAILTEINTWTKVPSIIVVTEPNPTFDNSATANFQEAENSSAEFSRLFASKNNLGLIDFNRQSNMVQNGIDVVNQIAEHYSTAIANTTVSASNIVTLPKTSSDFVINFNANLLAPTTGAFDYISFKLSKHPFDVLYFYPFRTVNQFELQTGIETITYSASPFLNNSYYDFKVVKTGGVISFYMADVLIFSSKTALLSQPLWEFQPVIEASKSFALTNISYTFSKHQKTSSSYTANEIWGVPNGTAGQKMPFGGNGINHPTTLGAKVIYADVVDNINWGYYKDVASSYQPLENQRLSTTNNVTFATTVVDDLFSKGTIATSNAQLTPTIVEAENSNAGVNAGSKFRTRFSGTETSYWWNHFNGGNFQTDLMSADFFTFITGASEKMRLTNAGSLAVGTTAPTAKLHVVGLLVFADNTAALAGGLTAGAFYRTATGVLMVTF